MKSSVEEVFHALDDLCVVCGIDLASYENPKDAINELIDWHVSVETDPRTNGGMSLRRQSKALENILYEIHRRADRERADYSYIFDITISSEDYEQLIEDGY